MLFNEYYVIDKDKNLKEDFYEVEYDVIAAMFRIHSCVV